MDHAELSDRYGREEYYWGTEPNDLARRAAEGLADPESAVVADVGAGEGRDAVYFAERGADVYAVDPIPEGLEKAERLADDCGVEVETLRGDVNDLELPEPVDLFYSIGTVQYLRPGEREAQFGHFREATRPGGIHAVFAFVDHPDVPVAPDWGNNEHFYAQGELRSYYEEWQILDEEALVFDDKSDGEPHQHAAEVVFAQKP